MDETKEKKATGTASATAPLHNGPIRIEGIILDEIGTPPNDGTRGSSLYRVPLQLSRRPSADWARHFVQTWNSPPSSGTSHRPGIARVEGNRIILDRTTVEEIEETHRHTLEVVLDKVNLDIAVHEASQRREREARDEEIRRHHQSAQEVAKRIKFD